MSERTTETAPGAYTPLSVTDAQVVKMCEIGQVLNPSVIELLRVAPMNQVARAQVLAACLKPIPPELSEFEQIKDWIEANIDPTVVNARTRRTMPTPTPQRPPGPTGPPPEDALTVVVDCEDVEYGRCRYAVNRYGSHHASYTREDLMEMIRNADSVGELVRELSDNSCAEANDDWPEMGWSDDGPDHDNHESNTVEDYNTTVNRNAIERDLISWMSENCRDQLLRLQGNLVAEPEEGEEDPEDHVPEE